MMTDTCGAYFGLGYGRGAAICTRPTGHPQVADDDIGHNDGIHPTHPKGTDD